jgi:hypothetical protein
VRPLTYCAQPKTLLVISSVIYRDICNGFTAPNENAGWSVMLSTDTSEAATASANLQFTQMPLQWLTKGTNIMYDLRLSRR